jgi:hypothetical protein
MLNRNAGSTNDKEAQQQGIYSLVDVLQDNQLIWYVLVPINIGVMSGRKASIAIYTAGTATVFNGC